MFAKTSFGTKEASLFFSSFPLLSPTLKNSPTSFPFFAHADVVVVVVVVVVSTLRFVRPSVVFRLPFHFISFFIGVYFTGGALLLLPKGKRDLIFSRPLSTWTRIE